VWTAIRLVSNVSPGSVGSGPTITATLGDGPLAGGSMKVEVVEGRPPKIIDVPVEDGSAYRYCLADWNQGGPRASYTFLYRVGSQHPAEDATKRAV